MGPNLVTSYGFDGGQWRAPEECLSTSLCLQAGLPFLPDPFRHRVRQSTRGSGGNPVFFPISAESRLPHICKGHMGRPTMIPDRDSTIGSGYFPPSPTTPSTSKQYITTLLTRYRFPGAERSGSPCSSFPTRRFTILLHTSIIADKPFRPPSRDGSLPPTLVARPTQQLARHGRKG